MAWFKDLRSGCFNLFYLYPQGTCYFEMRQTNSLFDSICRSVGNVPITPGTSIRFVLYWPTELSCFNVQNQILSVKAQCTFAVICTVFIQILDHSNIQKTQFKGISKALLIRKTNDDYLKMELFSVCRKRGHVLFVCLTGKGSTRAFLCFELKRVVNLPLHKSPSITPK